MKYKVLIIGDSLSLPRDEVQYEETWPYLLSEKSGENFHVINLSRRASTTKRLDIEGKDVFEYYNPDIVIIQLGIVDCSPRLMGSMESKIVSLLPKLLRKKYISIIKKVRNRSEKRVKVKLNHYRKYLLNYIKKVNEYNCKIICLKIGNVGKSTLVKNPKINISIENYNNVLKEICSSFDLQFIDPFFNSSDVNKGEYTIDDGYHLSAKGNQVISSTIIDYLVKFLSK